MEAFFTYIVKSGLGQQVVFTDYYKTSDVPTSSGSAIDVIDPVNPKNNVAINYKLADRQRIVDAAHRALDALGEARFAPTKGEEIENWQCLLGPSFKG